MLDQNDFKQIGALLGNTEKGLKEFVREELEENNKKLTKVIMVEVGTFITENVLTAIDASEERSSKGLETIESKLVTIEKKITALATRDDVIRAAADVKGTIIEKLRTQEEKVNLLIQFLKESGILSQEQWKRLHELQIFPSIEVEGTT